MGGHINDIPMIRWLVETSSKTEGGAGRAGGWEEGWRFEPRMSPALYADEEGRATMTRDVGAEDPLVFKPKRNSSGRKGGPPLARACHHLRCPSSPPFLLPKPDTLLCTTYPYINMSSSRGNRTDRVTAFLPSFLPFFLLILLLLFRFWLARIRPATPPAREQNPFRMYTKISIDLGIVFFLPFTINFVKFKLKHLDVHRLVFFFFFFIEVILKSSATKILLFLSFYLLLLIPRHAN